MRNPTLIPNGTPVDDVPLSITLGTLPAGEVLHAYDMPVTADYTHHLVVIAHGTTLDRAVETCRSFTGPARPLVFAALVVPDPDTDPAGYAAARWWAPGQCFDVALVEDMEDAGQLTVWPHNGAFRAVNR